MILADTSVWADHIRRGNGAMRLALERAQIVTHDFVVGELLLGHIRRGGPFLAFVFSLPRVSSIGLEQVVQFVRHHRLEGSGIGWTDANLLAAASAAGARLWSLDRALAAQAERIGIHTAGDPDPREG